MSERRLPLPCREIPLLVAALGLFASSLPAQVQIRDEDLTAPDGVKLRVSYFSPAKPGPGVLLFHECGGSDRKSWSGLAGLLAEGGFHVVTLDYRGVGESGGPRFSDADAQVRDAQQRKWPGDIDLALGYLLRQPGVDPQRVGAGGASCGANSAVDLAVRHPQVKSLVLLSGGASQAGIRYIRQSAWLPVFGAASRDDFDFVPYLRWLVGFSANPRSRFVEFPKAGHGTEMFAAEKGLATSIVEWFSRTLREATPGVTEEVSRDVESNPPVQFWSVLTGPGGFERALDMFHQARKRDPSAFLFPLSAVGSLGREQMRNGDLADAIETFRLNLEAYPNSAAACNDLAEAYMRHQDRELAAELSENTIARLAGDPLLNAEQRAFLRGRAEARLHTLRSASGIH